MHSAALLYCDCHTVTLSHCPTVRLSDCHTVSVKLSLSHCHRGDSNTVTLSRHGHERSSAPAQFGCCVCPSCSAAAGGQLLPAPALHSATAGKFKFRRRRPQPPFYGFLPAGSGGGRVFANCYVAADRSSWGSGAAAINRADREETPQVWRSSLGGGGGGFHSAVWMC